MRDIIYERIKPNKITMSKRNIILNGQKAHAKFFFNKKFVDECSNGKVTNRTVHPSRCDLSVLLVQALLVVHADLVSAAAQHPTSVRHPYHHRRHSGSPAHTCRRPWLGGDDARSTATKQLTTTTTTTTTCVCRHDADLPRSAADQGPERR